MAQRNYQNWLKEFVSLFTNSEVPESYAIWTGIWTIASVLRDNVGIARGNRLLDPHMYIFFVGPGAGGKSVTPDVAMDLLEGIGTIEVFPGEMTKSYMTKYLFELAQRQALTAAPNTTLIRPALTLYSDELGITLGTGDKASDMLRLMTQLYDSKFTYGTHAHGILKIERPVINWLALATVPWLKRSLPRDLIDSGFVARIITQREYLSPKIIPQVGKMDRDKLSRLQADLFEISILAMEYELSPEATAIHEHWYTITRKQRQGLKLDPITQGMLGREDEHSYKVVMCLKASSGDNPVITASELLNAVKLVEQARNSNLDLYRSLAVGEKRLDLKEYMKAKILGLSQPISHEELMRKTNSVMPDRKTAKEIINALMEDMVVEIVKGDGRGIYYAAKDQGNGIAESAC